MKFRIILVIIGLLVITPATQADIASVAEETFNLGQEVYPQYFPTPEITQTTGPWLYRYYPDTSIYLGVNKNDEGVYALGGVFGNTPQYIDNLDIIRTKLQHQISKTFDIEAEQVFNASQEVYPQYFPGNQPTQPFKSWVYRYYPDTGFYLAINKNDAGVYAVGGEYGSTPQYINSKNAILALLQEQMIDNVPLPRIKSGLVPAFLGYPNEPSAPTVTFTSHQDGDYVKNLDLQITGEVTIPNRSRLKTVTVNGIPANMNGSKFSAKIKLIEGANEILVVADYLYAEQVIYGISIIADTKAPALVSAISVSNTEVLVQFSEEVQSGEFGAENPSSYKIHAVNSKSGLPTNDALFWTPDATTILLSTSSQSELDYKLTISGIKDLAGNPMALPTILVTPSSTQFVGTGPSGDSILDTDHDGLADHVELLGWEVNVKNVDGSIVTRHVSSDPREQDTDQDGVNDNEELHAFMDPRSSDTDGDTLTDNQEWNTIYSDPTHQDSDGDGAQDGFEFYTFRTSPILVDTDGDQMSDPDEVFAGNRNPLVADLPSPRIRVDNVNLQLDTRFTFTDEAGESVTEEKSFESTLSRGENETFSTSNEKSTKSTLEFSQELSAKFNSGGGFKQAFPGVELSATAGSKQGSERASTFTVGQESGRSSEETYHESLSTSTAKDIRESVTREIIDAAVKVSLSIDNDGDIPFSISNLELTAQTQDPRNRRRVIPVASLIPENEALDSINIGALGDPSRGPFVFKTVSVFPAQVQELMKNPRGFVVQLANFDITDESGQNFAFTSQQVLDRTAGVTFDLGDGRVENYRVAAASTHDPISGQPVGITMEYALSLIGLQRYATIRDGGNGLVETSATGNDLQKVEDGRFVEPGAVIISATNDNGLMSTPGGDDVIMPADYKTVLRQDFDSIRDGGNGIAETKVLGDDQQLAAIDNPVSHGQLIISAGDNGVLDTIPGGDDEILRADAPRRVLTRFRDVEANAASKRFWVLFSSKAQSGVDLDNIIMRAGEQFDFTYVQDQDDDGVWAREEFLHGSSDLEINTDGVCDNSATPPILCDSLTDQQEIQEGWQVQLKGSPQAVRVYSNPVQGDSDRDLLMDDQEKACQLDPRQRDTDLDGLTDWEELHGLRIELGGIEPTEMVSRNPVTNEVVYTIAPYSGEGNGNDIFHSSFEDCDNALDDDDDHMHPVGVHGFATDPLNQDTDGDLVNDGLELQLGLNPNDSSDGPLFLDDDGDGVPNKLEEDGYLITVNGVADAYRVYSNPFDPDTDDDGLPDLLEHRLKSNPSPGVVEHCKTDGCTESGEDTDGDGISDLDEYRNGGFACATTEVGQPCQSFNTIVNDGWRDFLVRCEATDICDPASIDAEVAANSRQLGTNLNEEDSDFDGLKDPTELEELLIMVNGNPESVEAPSSNPLDADTDQDGITDGEEATVGNDGFITNPREKDTDGDGRFDANDNSGGFDPTFMDKKVTVKSTGFNITTANESGDVADLAWWAEINDIETNRCTLSKTEVQLNQFLPKGCTYFENEILKKGGPSIIIHMFGHEVDGDFDGEDLSLGSGDEVCNSQSFTFSYDENTDVTSVTAKHTCDSDTTDLKFETKLNITVD